MADFSEIVVATSRVGKSPLVTQYSDDRRYRPYTGLVSSTFWPANHRLYFVLASWDLLKAGEIKFAWMSPGYVCTQSFLFLHFRICWYRARSATATPLYADVCRRMLTHADSTRKKTEKSSRRARHSDVDMMQVNTVNWDEAQGRNGAWGREKET